MLARLFMLMLTTTVALGTTCYASSSRASEPSYCSLTTFLKTESTPKLRGVRRLHIFQLGQLSLAGLAIGESDYREVQKLADSYSSLQAFEKSCTFYMNTGNADAQKAFNFSNVASPKGKDGSIAKEFDKKITPFLDQTQTSMLSCAVNHKYVAMGCDGMRHRGPSAFAMLLAYSGCSAASSTAIANQVWGTNGVQVATRTAIAQKGFEAGSRNPAGRAALQALMTAK